MIAQTYTNYTNNLTNINLLDFRKDLGNILSDNQFPLQINKRGKAVGFVLPVGLGRDFLDWQNRQELQKLYISQKTELKNLGRDVLLQNKLINTKTDLDKLSADEIVELVSKI
jgi:hypothetical protein